MDWVGYNVVYMYNGTFVGIETIKLVAQDNMTVFSDVVTISLVVMENKCENGGVCKSKILFVFMACFYLFSVLSFSTCMFYLSLSHHFKKVKK